MPSKNGATRSIDAATAAHVAAHYVTATLGAAFTIGDLHATGTMWWARIQCKPPESIRPMVVGTVKIDGRSGEVVPLTHAEIREFQARVQLLSAHRRQELARDSSGYILPAQAKIKVTGYVAGEIAFFATAEGQPQWIDGTPPVWRVEVALRLRSQGQVCDLGTVDVNALTGEVLPLNEQEISFRQKRAHNAAEAITRSAAATG